MQHDTCWTEAHLIVAYWRFEVVKKHAGRRGKEATFGQWEWGTDADVALDRRWTVSQWISHAANLVIA